MPLGARCVPGPKEAHAWFTSGSTCIASVRTWRSSRRTAARRLLNDREAFRALVGELGTDAKFALEPTYGWEWLAELLEDAGCELDLAHPHARVPTLTTAADDYAGGPYGLGGGRRCGADRGSRRDPAAVQRGVRCDRRPLADDREPGQPRVVADAGARGHNGVLQFGVLADARARHDHAARDAGATADRHVSVDDRTGTAAHRLAEAGAH